MRVLVASHPSAMAHDTSPMHPERPQRVEAVLEGIADSGLEVVEMEVPEITREKLALVHDPEYVAMVEMFCQLGGGALDMDTIVSSGSWEAALTAAGSVEQCVHGLDDGQGDIAFAVARPPGHHALPDRAMGFCLFNNVAVAAALIRARGERVAVLDWDVHHGNGTQKMVLDDPGTLYVSLHQSPFYPYEGEVGDIDSGDAKGTTVNIPLPAATGGDAYLEAWSGLVVPVVRQFAPDWVLVSAGYDAHVADPLADLRLTAADYGRFTALLAVDFPTNRTVLTLEGGYDLGALRESVSATLAGSAGDVRGADPLESPATSFEAVEAAAEAIGRHWSI